MSLTRSVALAAVIAAFVTPAPAKAEPAETWQLNTVAGIGDPGYSGDGGPATDARLADSVAYGPRLAVGADGTVYVAEWANHRLRRVTPDGVIDTVPGSRTRTGNPRAVAVAPDGTVYLTIETGIFRFGAGGVTQLPTDESALLSDIEVDRAGNVFYVKYSFDADSQERTSIVRADRAGATTTVVEEKTELYAIAVDPAGTVYYTTGRFEPNGAVVHAVGPDGVRRQAAVLPAGGIAGAVAIAPDGAPYVVDVNRGRLLRIEPSGTLTQLGPSLATRIDDLAFGPDGTPYLVVGSTVRRLDKVTGDGTGAAPARSRWAGDAPGTVHRVAGTGAEPATDQTGLSAPAVGPDGTVYVAQPGRNVVHAIGRDGRAEVFAGTGEYHADVKDPHAYNGRQARDVDLAFPHAVAADRDGNVYIATRLAILRVAEDGVVRTVAAFARPTGPVADLTTTPQLAVDDTGTLHYTADNGGGSGAVRTVGGDSGDAVLGGGGDNLPGHYSDGKPAVDADLRAPTSVSVGADGTVFVIETVNGSAVHAVRAIRPDGVLVTAAGDTDADLSGNGGFAGDGGPATAAELNNPRGVAAGPDGSFYLADTYNGRVRRVERSGVITTVAGTGRRADTGDGGPAAEASMIDPAGLAVGADGTLYVTSPATTAVRAISPAGTVTTLADLAGPAARLPLAEIGALDVGPDGTVYLGARDGVLAVAPDGTAATVDGLATMSSTATGRDGSVYQVVAAGSGDPDERPAELWRRHPDGTVVRLAVDDPLTGVVHVAVGPDDEIHLATYTAVFRLEDGQPARVLSTEDEPFDSLGGGQQDIQAIAAASDGALYVVAVNQVFAVRDGKAELVAGNGEQDGAEEDAEDGGPARDATLEAPSDVAVTGDGTVFIATGEGVRRVSGGVIETVAAGDDVVRLAAGPSGDLYAASADQVFVVVQPAKVTVDRTSWTWVWFVVGAGVLLAAAVLGYRRTRKSTVDSQFAQSP